MLFRPAVRPAPQFVAEVRADLEQPVHLDITPRGFDNPLMLCYRNSVVAALLNTSRVLTFLHAHMRQSRRFYSHHKVSGHLLTRLYHLAVAYWDRDGRHPMEPNDDYERLLTLFWRACKSDSTQDDANAGVTDVFECWLSRCNRQPGQSADVALFRRQQDAMDMLSWLLEAVGKQLGWYPEQYGHGQSLRNFDSVFEVRTTTRFVCPACRNPVRLRRPEITRSVGLPTPVYGRTPRPGARVQRLVDIIERNLNDVIEDGRFCDRCEKTACMTRVLHRLQTAPEVLAVQLLRMRFAEEIGGYVKMHDRVDFPQFLDVSRWLEPHLFGRNSRIVYRLSAVISHHGDGNRTGGHYVTFTRRRGPTQTFKQAYDPAVVLADMLADEQLQASIDDRMRMEGIARPAPGQDAGQDAGQSSGPFDDFWPVPDKCRVRELENEDNGWVCISDKTVVEGVPFRKITNTTRDVDHNIDSSDWFDPIMMIYEKCVEEFDKDCIVGERVFQRPMNLGLGHGADDPLPEQCPPAVLAGEPVWAYVEHEDGHLNNDSNNDYHSDDDGNHSGSSDSEMQRLFAGKNQAQPASKNSKRKSQLTGKPAKSAKPTKKQRT